MLPVQWRIYISAAVKLISLSPQSSSIAYPQVNVCKKNYWTTSQNCPSREIILWGLQEYFSASVLLKEDSAHWSEKDTLDNRIILLIYADFVNAGITDTSTAAYYYWYARRIQLPGKVLS